MLSFIVNVQTHRKPQVSTESKCRLKKNTIISILMIILAVTLASMPFFPSAKAANVEITYISLATGHGKVGEQVRVLGTVNTTGDSYQIWFGNNITEFRTVVNATSAVGTEVNATFLIPRVPGGNYTLKLQDVSTNVNYTAWLYVDTAYYIEARDLSGKPFKAPAQLQEGGFVGIWVNVTGAEASKAYVANITVVVPSPANTTYWVTSGFTTTSIGDFSNLMITYPNTTFHGTPAPHMNFTGAYTIALNKTSSKTLATSAFTVGMTNATEYHRRQYVDIKAIGYKLGENVTVKILFGTTALKKENVTTKNEGIVTANWTIPSDASIGVYTLNITSMLPSSSATIKSPPDIQTFTVPGFKVDVTTRNLAGESVSKIIVKVFENGKIAANATSNSSGSVSFKLEIGSYLCNATLRDKKVGERTINVTDAASFDLTCNLTNLKILVVNENATVRIPEAKIALAPESLTLTTDVNGTAVAHSLFPVLPNATQQYVINASRYDESFNVTRIQTLLVNATPVAWFNVTIFCPTLTLQIIALDAGAQPITNITVKVQEYIGGLYSEGKTDSAGKAVFSFIFGRYLVGVYDADGIKLNETTVDLFQNENVSISCVLYGLTVSVKVVDYLGQPISNANVILQREGMATRSARTQSDGTVTFSGVTGGTFQVTVYLSDQAQPSAEGGFLVAKSATIEIRVEKYLTLAGMLVETSQFAIVLVVVLTVLIVLVLEIYRRRRLKPQKSES